MPSSAWPRLLEGIEYEYTEVLCPGFPGEGAMVSDFDPDLVSIQEARTLVRSAKRAQVAWATATQADVDRVCSAMAQAGAAEIGRASCRERG